MWTKTKKVTVGDIAVETTSTKIEAPQQLAVIETVATVGGISYTERWTLPHGNHAYTEEQAQKDFNTHLLKVATEAVGRHVSHSAIESLE